MSFLSPGSIQRAKDGPRAQAVPSLCFLTFRGATATRNLLSAAAPRPLPLTLILILAGKGTSSTGTAPTSHKGTRLQPLRFTSLPFSWRHAGLRGPTAPHPLRGDRGRRRAGSRRHLPHPTTRAGRSGGAAGDAEAGPVHCQAREPHIQETKTLAGDDRGIPPFAESAKDGHPAPGRWTSTSVSA